MAKLFLEQRLVVLEQVHHAGAVRPKPILAIFAGVDDCWSDLLDDFIACHFIFILKRTDFVEEFQHESQGVSVERLESFDEHEETYKHLTLRPCI